MQSCDGVARHVAHGVQAVRRHATAAEPIVSLSR
jgi:hypothetical protein